MTQSSLSDYDAEHIREALIHDERVNALDAQIHLSGNALVVTGNVPSEERRQAITAVIAELAPGIEIRNDVSVADLSQPDGQEVVQ